MTRARFAFAAALMVAVPALCRDARDLTAEEREAFLRRAKVVQQKEVKLGITQTKRVTMTDGEVTHDAQFQKVDIAMTQFSGNRGSELNFRDCWKYNVAAYRLGKLLGIDTIPPSVERRQPGFGTVAATWWIDDVMMDEGTRLNKKLTAPDESDWAKQIYVVRVFDELIYNTDRNVGNMLITKDWKIWMIDHTRAFRRHTTLKTPAVLGRCDRALLTQLKKLDRPTLERELKPYLNGEEIKGVLARRDRIIELFEHKCKSLGEEKVLYDLAKQ